MYWFTPFFNINLCGGDTGAGNIKRLTKYKNKVVWQNVFSNLLLDPFLLIKDFFLIIIGILENENVSHSVMSDSS